MFVMTLCPCCFFLVNHEDFAYKTFGRPHSHPYQHSHWSDLCNFDYFGGWLYVHCLKPYEYKLYTFFHVFCMYSVLLSTDLTYSCVPGDQGGPILFRWEFFSAVVLCTNWCTTICITCPILCKIECNKLVCDEFVLVFLQVDIIQYVL